MDVTVTIKGLPDDNDPCEGSLWAWVRPTVWPISPEDQDGSWTRNLEALLSAILTTPVAAGGPGAMLASAIDGTVEKVLQDLPDAEQRRQWLDEYAHPGRTMFLEGSPAKTTQPVRRSSGSKAH
jgi:hypothetical protein